MLGRFKTKVLRRPSPSGRSGSPPPRAQTKTSHSDRFGLHTLFSVAEGQADSSSPQKYPVDIIAVHGLNGDAYSTWTHPTDGTLWLRDLLPASLPGCRVYTYGYPSQIFSESSARVQEFARSLLISIRDLQEDSTTGTRPVIFVCHSLGGIVFKQALVLAHEDEKYYGQVLKSIVGVAFLGTPHRGSGMASLATVFGTILNAFTTAASAGVRPGAVRIDLLESLSTNSNALNDLVFAARNRLDRLVVVSFYENYPIDGLSSLIVDRNSATLGIANEEIIPLLENHRSICRFPGETQSYNTVARALRRIAAQSISAVPALKRASTHSSNRTLSEVERLCVKLLNPDDPSYEDEKKPRPMKPIPGTCQWIHSHSLFVSWLESASNALLWLTGGPGCGKTILSFALAKYFEENSVSKKSRNVLIYFCDNTHSKQTDARAVVIGLIFQIVTLHRSMISHVRRVFELQGQSMIWSFSSLWSIFLRIVKDPKIGSLYVILDALDECEKASCRQLLDSISEMLADSIHSVRSGAGVKFLITSRPFLHQSYARANQALQLQITIDERQTGYVADLQRFIQQRIEEISINRQYSSEIKDYLLETMLAKADQTFLWIHVILTSVEESLLTSLKDFRNIIASIPKELADTYTRYLSAIPSDHQEHVSHLLKLLLASSRPLHLDELNVAFTINPSHATADDIARDVQTAFTHTVQGMLGPLARISGNQVSLVHQSLKEFFLETAKNPGSFCATRLVNTDGSALQMASACIQYLRLDEFKNDLFSTTSSSAEAVFEFPDLRDELPIGDILGNFWDDQGYDLDSDMLFREPAALNPEICRSLSSKYSFYRYASLHWTEHFAICENSAPKELKDAARQLLETERGSCRNWLHFYCTQSATSIDDTLVDQHPVVLAAYFNLNSTLNSLLENSKPTQSIKNRSLFWASRLGHNEIVISLLAAGAEPESQELERQTALTTASEHGQLACVVTLLADERARINGQGRNGRSTLSFACGNGFGDITKELLSRENCIVDDVDHLGSTPFVWAVEGGHTTIISALAKHPGVNINHQDKTGRTAVSWAAGEGMDDILALLLQLPGVDINSKDNTGKSPLSWAAGNGCVNTTALLLQSAMVDKTSVDKDMRNAISWASGGGHYGTLVRLLEKEMTGVDTEDIDGWTPLAWAIQTDSPETVRALISTGCVQIERRDRGGRTALSWAIEYRQARVVEVLLQAGAEPEAGGNGGGTPEPTT